MLNHGLQHGGSRRDLTNGTVGFLVIRPTKDETKWQKDHLFINETINLVVEWTLTFGNSFFNTWTSTAMAKADQKNSGTTLWTSKNRRKGNHYHKPETTKRSRICWQATPKNFSLLNMYETTRNRSTPTNEQHTTQPTMFSLCARPIEFSSNSKRLIDA